MVQRHTLLMSLASLPRRAVIKLIEAYQQTLSPDHGALRHLYPYGYCRHEPTCSDYMKQTIAKRGLLIGGVLSFLRILGCNPFRKPSAQKLQKLAAKLASQA